LIIVLNNGDFSIQPKQLELVDLLDQLYFLGGLQDYLDVLVLERHEAAFTEELESVFGVVDVLEGLGITRNPIARYVPD
jgi:hypothetical protein